MEWTQNPAWIITVLMFCIAFSEWLVQNTKLKSLGTALLVILVTAIIANLGIIPTNSTDAPVYDDIFSYVAPIGIFLLLLEVNLKNLRKAGTSMIVLFLIGMAATAIGVLSADYLVNAAKNIGENHYAISGMFTGTYTGGSINFNAIALHYEINKVGNLYAGSVAIDNIITTIWMIATLGLPKVLQNFFPRKSNIVQANNSGGQEIHSDEEKLGPFDAGILLGVAILSLIVSEFLADELSGLGIVVPSILILTTIALILAQFKFFQNLKGARLLGLIAMYLFLAVIGAFCDLATLGSTGYLAFILLIYVLIVISIHGLLIFGFGGILKSDWIMVSIASQANVGGSTSALALARSLGRPDLMLPAVLVGVLGNGLGTYLGFLIAELLR